MTDTSHGFTTGPHSGPSMSGARDARDEVGGLVDRASWAEKEEIDTFDQFVQRFRQGKISPDEFKRFRLQNGIYGQRQEGEQMVRVKIPWGGLTAAQLELLAEVAAESPRGVGHVTTRQNMQFHFVKLDRVPALLERLASAGLTTREACGNTVRNVTVGHCAGVCPKEAFDVTPYANAVARYLLRNPMNQNLPRKFKIAFSGCLDDLGLTPIHDMGRVPSSVWRMVKWNGASNCMSGVAWAPRPGSRSSSKSSPHAMGCCRRSPPSCAFSTASATARTAIWPG